MCNEINKAVDELIEAVRNSNEEEVVRLLEEEEVDIDERGSKGYTALHEAISMEGYEMVELLCYHGADPSQSLASGLNSFHVAASADPIGDIMSNLVSAGDGSEDKDSQGRTPLHISADYDDFCDAMIVLLDSGVDLDVQDNQGRTPMHYAADREDTYPPYDIFDYFKKNEEVSIIKLVELSKESTIYALVLLIEYGADLNSRDAMGKTPLHYALTRWSFGNILMLVMNGADVNIKDRFGMSAYEYACHNWGTEYADMFLKKDNLEKSDLKISKQMFHEFWDRFTTI